MGRAIIKLSEYYLEWSTIVDAPTTFGMKLDEFKKYYRQRYGTEGMKELPERLERVEKKGTSFHEDTSYKETIRGNRAGPDESKLSEAEIVKAYCLQKPIRNGWIAK